MKSSALLSLLTILPLTSAWSITWNDPSGNDHTRTGQGPSACIPIDNPKGHLFSIDAQGETGINMLLFTNEDCKGDPAGMATDKFSKDSSKDLLGFRVVRLESATGTGTGTGANPTATVIGGMTGATTKAHSSHVTTTGGGASTSASADSSSVVSATTQTSVVTSAAAATTTSGAAAGVSSSSSSAASASTSNAAVRVVGSTADVAMGVVGGMLGLVVVPMMI